MFRRKLSAVLLVAAVAIVGVLTTVERGNHEGGVAVASRYHLRSRSSNFFDRSKMSNVQKQSQRGGSTFHRVR